MQEQEKAMSAERVVEAQKWALRQNPMFEVAACEECEYAHSSPEEVYALMAAFATEEVGLERERTIIECAEFIEKWRPCICNKKFDTTCGHAVNCYWYISYGIRELTRDGRE